MKNVRKALLTAAFILAGYIIIGLKAFHPFHRQIAICLYLASVIPLVIAVREKWKQLGPKRLIFRKKLIAYSPHIVIAVILLICLRAAWVLVPVEKSPLTEMTDTDIRQSIQDDLVRLDILNKNSAALLSSLESNLLLDPQPQKLTPESRTQLKNMWYEFLMLSFEYELIKNKYKGFYQVDYVAKPALHCNAFFIAFSAFTNQYASALNLTSLIDSNPSINTILNEPADKYPTNSLYDLKQKLTHPDSLLQLSAGTAYLQLVKKDITLNNNSTSKLQKQAQDIYKKLSKNPKILLQNPLEFLERSAFVTWFPIQKAVAHRMSKIRTTARDYFISYKALEKYKQKLLPGDILLERRNWHMTNIGIPGFWPHVAFFIGTSTDIDNYFAGIKILNGKPASLYLKEKYPKACDSFIEKDELGFDKNILEALDKGIIFTSIEKSGHADYLAAVRPKLSKEEKFNAIIRALSYWSRPYDYNFDFMTDDALVCSELIYKAYEDTKNLTFKPSIINGRYLLPPHLIIQKFDEEFDTPNRQIDFVFYLEGNEEKATFFEKDVKTFRKSVKYPKWDIMQK